MTTPQLSYPGVYVQEVPSGSRSIVGVPTAVTAFVGRALRGPVDEPVAISSFGDFERSFGGLWRESGLGYAVRDYYLNGGGNAIVVRLRGGAAEATTQNFFGNDVAFIAAEPGSWANGTLVRLTPGVDVAAADTALDNAKKADDKAVADLRRAIATAADTATAAEEAAKEKQAAAKQAAEDAAKDVEAKSAARTLAAAALRAAVARKAAADAAKGVAERQGVTPSDLWDVTVVAPGGTVLETFPAVTFVDGPRRVDLVLKSSRVLRLNGALPQQPPQPANSDPVEHTLRVDGDGKGTDGTALGPGDYIGDASAKTGIHALERADLFTLLCLPPSTPSDDLDATVWSTALDYCESRKALLLVDPPKDATLTSIGQWPAEHGLTGPGARNAALYFPRLLRPDPLRDGAIGSFVPCGAVAGVMASTDASRGVWKAPAGLEAGIGAAPAYALTDPEHGQLPDEVNALRAFPNVGTVVWGARTLRGADVLADDYKYVPVRRLALFLEQSLYRGTQWVVFEPNDEPLWSQIRATLTAFMQDLFRQGAFQGRTPKEAYFVHCGADTTTPYDVARGLVNIRVGFAPLRPAEFVVVGIQQMTAAAS